MTRPPVRGEDDWDDRGGVAAAPPGPRSGPAHARPAAGWDDDPDDDADDDPDDEWDDGDYEELRPESGRGRRVLFVLVGLVVVFVVLVVVAAFVVRGRLDPSGPPGDEVQVAIATGSTNGDIASLLEDEGIVPDAQAFEYYLRYKGAEGFQAGQYLFQENSAAWDALGVLEAQPLPPDTASFTVPEGLMVAEYPAQIVDDLPAFDQNVLAELITTGQVPKPPSLADAPSYEGLLFPDTYQVEAGMDELAVLSRMTAQLERIVVETRLVERSAEVGLTPYEVLTVASLIQEEYGLAEEMGQIARVIYNRLDIGEPLGIDATSRYEAVLAGRDRDDVDFESDSPYNTRRSAGLPPTPIAAPGREAIEAALAPADGPWIYYVRDPDQTRTPPGGHFFTDSAREFEQVKAECEEAGLGCG